MARYIKDITLNKPEDFVTFMMNDYLQKNQFSMSDWKGEPAYRAGDAMLEGFKFLKWSYGNGVLHLEAWMKGTFGGEWNLDGFVGCAMKKPYKESLEQLFKVMEQDIPQEQMESGQAIPVETVDNSKAATFALVFGALSLLFCWWPIIAILFGCLGFSRARLGSGSSKAKLANLGKIFSILGVVVGVVLWGLNFLSVFM